MGAVPCRLPQEVTSLHALQVSALCWSRARGSMGEKLLSQTGTWQEGPGECGSHHGRNWAPGQVSGALQVLARQQIAHAVENGSWLASATHCSVVACHQWWHVTGAGPSSCAPWT